MRRSLLISLLCGIAAITFSQAQFPHLTGHGKDMKVKQQPTHPGQASLQQGESTIGQKFFDNSIIGTTWYDVQSYTNVMQRIWAYDDGTVGATWMSAGQNLVPQRGTAYNYFDGAEWGTPNPHVGPSDRMGWPSYCPWGPNGEIIAQYYYVAGAGPIRFYKREIKGTGEWVETVLDPPPGYSLVWHSMCTSGENHEYIHLLAYTYDADYNGQTNALLYYRSSDGAETWDISEEVIEGLGPDYFPSIHSLTYSWANPVGETIAFTYGFDELGGWVFKSTDNGETWTSIQAMETTLDPFNLPVDSERTPCGSGTSAIALDSQGNAHVVFGRMSKIYTGGDLFYYPFTDGLIYWNESMPVIDTAMISSYTMDYLYDAGMLCGWVMTEQPTYTIPEGQPNYSNSMCSYPQLSIDAEDNIFVGFCALAPDYSNTEYYYRHIIVNSTYDLGESWVGMIDLNTDIQYIFSECAYPMLSPVIGDYVHVVFQEDPFPGIAEWLTNHDAIENQIMHMAIDKDVFVGVKEKGILPVLELSVFPNPAANEIRVQTGLKNASGLNLKMTDQLGRVVLCKDLGWRNEGKQNVAVDVSALSPGVYFVRVSAGNETLTKKVVIQ